MVKTLTFFLPSTQNSIEMISHHLLPSLHSTTATTRTHFCKPVTSDAYSKLHCRTPFPVKTKTLFSSKSVLLSTPCSKLPNRFVSNNPGLSERGKLFLVGFKPWAIPGLNSGGFRSTLSVVISLAILSTIIIVHELGHLFAASLQGIRVSEFAVGFGPIIGKTVCHNVEYSIRVLPLGGFVSFPGSHSGDTNVNLLENRRIFDRFLVGSGGIIANLMFAYVILLVQGLSVGFNVRHFFPGVIVREIEPFSAASRDGLIAGDVILGVNDIELLKTGPSLVSQVVDEIRKSQKSKLVFKIRRGGEKVVVDVTPNDETGRLGLRLQSNVEVSKLKPENLFEAFDMPRHYFMFRITLMLDVLRKISLNEIVGAIASPVAGTAMGAEIAKSDLAGLYRFAVELNLNVAMVNILPIPAMDGGGLVLLLVEAARGGRKLPAKVEQGITSTGITIYTVLGVYILLRDMKDLLKKESPSSPYSWL